MDYYQEWKLPLKYTIFYGIVKPKIFAAAYKFKNFLRSVLGYAMM